MSLMSHYALRVTKCSKVFSAFPLINEARASSKQVSMSFSGQMVLMPKAAFTSTASRCSSVAHPFSTLSKMAAASAVVSPPKRVCCGANFKPNVYEVLLNQCAAMPPETRSMRQSILSHRGGIISEFKRRSPSKDWIKREARVEDIIPAYEAAGAAAISVLTDNTYFGGSLQDLMKARSLTNLPILRKDFVIDAYQLLEARVAGADACLLIAAALGADKCHELAEVAHNLKLEVLLEVHCAEELAAYSKHVDIIAASRIPHTFIIIFFCA